MSNLKFCPDCGAELLANDRFCGNCGFDIQSWAPPISSPQTTEDKPVYTATPAAAQHVAPGFQPGGGQQMTAGNSENLGHKSRGNKSALFIILSLLAVLFLAGGGLYWWLSQGNDPENGTSIPSSQSDGISNTDGQKTNSNGAESDLTRASTYLSEPGLKCIFSVNYPDGTAGVVERISGLAVPNETVRVSEVEIGVDQGVDFGYGFHYVERADGTYYILDQAPNEITPLLKNNLAIGQTWNYQDEFGEINWTVVDIGVDLNLGFAVFEDCLLVKEDNQAAQFQSITYYAPGRGSVLVIDPSGSTEYYKLTSLVQIDLAQAADTIKKWCPNYYDIGDDRTQSY